MLDSRDQKIKAILASPAAASRPKDRTPAHYLEPTRTSWLDPQRFFQRYPGAYRILTTWLAPRLPFTAWRKYFPDFKTSIVLNLGCGTQRLDPDIINVDFVDFPHIDITADFSEALPIKDQCIDGIVSMSVLEHMESPHLAAREIVRVLRRGGVLYVNTPFLYPYHAAPNDYTRWTLSGLSQLFGEEMEVVESGPRGGVFCVCLITATHFIAQLLCCGSEKLYRLLNHLSLAVLAPIKYFDFFTIKLPFTSNLCPSFFWIAKKK